MSKDELRALRKMHKLGRFRHDCLDFLGDDIRTKQDILNSLTERGYIIAEMKAQREPDGEYRSFQTGEYRVSPRGKEFIETRTGRWVRAWWPLIISTVALLVSLSEGLQLLLKSIARWLLG